MSPTLGARPPQAFTSDSAHKHLSKAASIARPSDSALERPQGCTSDSAQEHRKYPPTRPTTAEESNDLFWRVLDAFALKRFPVQFGQ